MDFEKESGKGIGGTVSTTINRRGFLGAAASLVGLAAVPAWGLFQQRRREIDLTQFCEDNFYGRYDITKPFAQGGSVIGTDAKVLVRTTLAAQPELDDERWLPNIEKLLDWKSEPKKWLKWPKETYLGTRGRYGNQCPFCDGKGGTINVRKCGTCNGDGYQPIENDPDEFNTYEAPCKTCQKTGWLWDAKCSHCGGMGETKLACYQPIENIFVASHYDARLRKLGDLQFCLHGIADYQIVRFRGDGFDGLLMPLNVTRDEVLV